MRSNRELLQYFIKLEAERVESNVLSTIKSGFHASCIPMEQHAYDLLIPTLDANKYTYKFVPRTEGNKDPFLKINVYYNL